MVHTERLSPLLLIHHAARRNHNFPPNSLGALRACLDAGACLVEVDVIPLAGGDFALLHDGDLARTTDGKGSVTVQTAEHVRCLHYTWQGRVTDEPVALLTQAVILIRGFPGLVELQLDLKPEAPLTERLLRELLRVVAPVRERVRVTSMADWALRRLRALDAELALGFDPLLYLDLDTEGGRDASIPPFRVGAYGYCDDHPLASRVWGARAEYLMARADALAAQAPPGVFWYIKAELLCCALDDGFDWIAYLHRQGAGVDAWTLDCAAVEQIAAARRLATVGVDRITTNDAPRLAEAMAGTGRGLDEPRDRRIAY